MRAARCSRSNRQRRSSTKVRQQVGNAGRPVDADEADDAEYERVAWSAPEKWSAMPTTGRVAHRTRRGEWQYTVVSWC